MRFAGGDGEAFLLVRVQMLGDRASRQAAPVEANDILRTVLSGCREGDGLAGGGIGDRSELDNPIVLAGSVVGIFWRLGDVAAGRAGHELTLSAARWGWWWRAAGTKRRLPRWRWAAEWRRSRTWTGICWCRARTARRIHTTSRPVLGSLG